MSISEIQCEKDLRKLPFFDLFYGIYDEPDGDEISSQLIRRFSPDFAKRLHAAKLEAAKLKLLRNNLEATREERQTHEMFKGLMAAAGHPFFSPFTVMDDYMDKMDEMDRRLLDAFAPTLDFLGIKNDSTVKDFLEKGDFEKALSKIFGEFVARKYPTKENSGYPVLIYRLVRDAKLYGDFVECLDQRITETISAPFAGNKNTGNKIIKGLFLLPYLETDQEMIIFFGSNFHATFASVDAYTGLLYASEYFDFEMSASHNLANSIAEKDVEEAEKSLISAMETARNERAYERACENLEAEKYSEAYNAFTALGSFRDSASQAAIALKRKLAKDYDTAVALFEKREFSQAAEEFAALGEYRDAAERVAECKKAEIDKPKIEAYEKALDLLEKHSYREAKEVFASLGDWKDAPSMIEESDRQRDSWQYGKAAESRKLGDYAAAIKIYRALGTYRDSPKLLEETVREQEEDRVRREREKEKAEQVRLENAYKTASALLKKRNYGAAEAEFAKLGEYLDSPAKREEAAAKAITKARADLKEVERKKRELEKKRKELESKREDLNASFRELLPSELEKQASCLRINAAYDELNGLGLLSFSRRRELYDLIELENERLKRFEVYIPIQAEKRNKMLEEKLAAIRASINGLDVERKSLTKKANALKTEIGALEKKNKE